MAVRWVPRRPGADQLTTIDFDAEPASYRHWRLELEPPIATLTLCVSPDHGLRDDYELKLNSYDLSVDIELHDAVQRLRFEHPEVGAVVITGGLEKVFCAGANIQMLAGASHVHKVNFCKFTNETRNSIEDATSRSAQTWIAAVNGTAAGGGYELALACDEIVLVDDRASAVSLPELPLLGVLPGTGGLTRVVDKRLVRRDRADVFATKSEGIKGQQAVEWGLVDVLAPPSKFADVVRARALARAATSTRPGGPGVLLTPLARTQSADGLAYDYLTVTIDRPLGAATFTLTGPKDPQPTYPDELLATGAAAWIIAAARQLDDAILRMRFNEPEIGTWVLRTEGEIDAVLAADALLEHHADHWLVNEVRLLWRRTLSRLDLSARSLVALVEAGSCFAGTLAELVLAADRSYMLDDPAGSLNLSAANDGWYPMVNGLSRLQTRFWGRDANLDAVRADLGKALDARAAVERGLVTFTPDDLDWDEEVRVALEERASFSPDALTAMEANLRFVGPETMESRIFARLSAWQNWVFQRPNAAGPDGALKRYGTGARPVFDKART